MKRSVTQKGMISLLNTDLYLFKLYRSEHDLTQDHRWKFTHFRYKSHKNVNYNQQIDFMKYICLKYSI